MGTAMIAVQRDHLLVQRLRQGRDNIAGAGRVRNYGGQLTQTKPRLVRQTFNSLPDKIAMRMTKLSIVGHILRLRAILIKPGAADARRSVRLTAGCLPGFAPFPVGFEQRFR
ncbi:Uncharacterised protein [Enterobacter cloacae]|nr:Uncharacterised protein [Enterobacter cloacae]